MRSSSALCFAASSSGSMPRMELRLSSVPFAASFSVSSPAVARAATRRARAPTATRATPGPIERTARGFDATRAGAVAPASAPAARARARRARAPVWRRWLPCRTFARLPTRRRVRVKCARGCQPSGLRVGPAGIPRGDLSEHPESSPVKPSFQGSRSSTRESRRISHERTPVARRIAKVADIRRYSDRQL